MDIHANLDTMRNIYERKLVRSSVWTDTRFNVDAVVCIEATRFRIC